jgi:hypothetical protein
LTKRRNSGLHRTMAGKRVPPDDEIEAMAETLRPLVKRGETIRPFLRRNQHRLREIVDEESWATLALVMTKLGMTYSTGRAWTGHTIRVELTRSIAPRARERARQKITEPPVPLPSAPTRTPHAELSRQPSGVAESRFKPATPRPAPMITPASSATKPETKFKPSTVRAVEPPREPTQAEIKEQEEIQKRFFPS